MHVYLERYLNSGSEEEIARAKPGIRSEAVIEGHPSSATDTPVTAALPQEAADRKEVGWMAGASREESDPANQIFTDNVKEKCKFVCAICRKVVVNLRGHATSCHKLTPGDYRKLHPNMEYQRETYHRYRS